MLHYCFNVYPSLAAACCTVDIVGFWGNTDSFLNTAWLLLLHHEYESMTAAMSHVIFNFYFYIFRLCVIGSTCEILCNWKYFFILKLSSNGFLLHITRYEINQNPVGVTALKRLVHSNFIIVQCRKDSCIRSCLSSFPHFYIYLSPSFYVFVLHFVMSIVVSLFLLMFHSLFVSYSHFLSFYLCWHVCLFGSFSVSNSGHSDLCRSFF